MFLKKKIIGNKEPTPKGLIPRLTHPSISKTLVWKIPVWPRPYMKKTIYYLCHRCGNTRSLNLVCQARDQICILALQRGCQSCCARAGTPHLVILKCVPERQESTGTLSGDEDTERCIFTILFYLAVQALEDTILELFSKLLVSGGMPHWDPCPPPWSFMPQLVQERAPPTLMPKQAGMLSSNRGFPLNTYL